MNEYLILFIFLAAGYAIGVSSVILGFRISSKIIKGSPPEVLLPEGDAFTISTNDDQAFPDEESNKAEEHIQKKTAKFLERFGGVK